MRFLVNAMPAHGPRSGVGHYTAELLRCLYSQAEPHEQITAAPGPWVGRLRKWMQPASAPVPAAGGDKGGLASKFKGLLKPLGRSLLRQYLRAVAWSGR